MKPEPVRPLHGSILGAQKNRKLPLISKKVGRGSQPLPLRCRHEPSGHSCLVRAEQSPGICFTGGNPEQFPPKQQIHSCWASTERTPPEPPSTAKSRAHSGGVRGLRPAPHCFACLGEPKLPYSCSSNLKPHSPRGWVEFPLIYSHGGKGPAKPKCCDGDQNQCLGLCVLCAAEGTLSLFNRLEILIIDIKI